MQELTSVLDFEPPLIAENQRLQTTVSPAAPDVSVVIPVYRAEDCLQALYERLVSTLDGLQIAYEIIFVEDCGPDNSWAMLENLASGDRRVRSIKLSRNFGQQMAITAGLERSRGQWIVVMDCDLQDPPEKISELYQRANQGFDIVLAKRVQRKNGMFRLVCNRVYFGMLNVFAQANITGQYGSFSIISRRVRDAFLQFSDRNRHYLMILFWLGFDVSDIEYEQADRFAGESSYTLKSLIKLAIEGVFFQTTVLLKFIVALGFLVSVAGVLLATWAIWSYFAIGALPGWTSVTVLTLLLGGAILVSQGIVGLYIGEIFDNVKQRPLYVVSKEVALD